MVRGSRVKFASKPYSKSSRNKKEGYQQLNLIGTPQHSVEVDDSVFLGENKLLGTYMEPNFKKQPYVPRSHEYTHKLDLFTGRNLKPLLDRPEKKENVPLFKPFKQDYIANRNDIMEKKLAMASRYRDETSQVSRKFEKPTPEIKVAPGVDIGYNAEPSNRPFHSWYRPPALNVDELRGEVRPDYTIDRTEGGLKGNKSYIMPKKKNLKRRPEAIYGQGNQSRVIPGIATFSKGANDRLATAINRTVKKTESSEHFGNEYREHDYKSLPDKRKPFRDVTKRHTRPDESTRVGASFTRDHDDSKYDRTMNVKPKATKRMNIVSERDGNIKPLTMMSNNPNTKGKGMHKDLLNKELHLQAVRDGNIDGDYTKTPYTNKETLLLRSPQTYNHERDNRGDYSKSKRRNEHELDLPESKAYKHVGNQRAGADTHHRANKVLDKNQYNHMRNPIEHGVNDRRGVGEASSRKAPNRGSKKGLRKERMQNSYIDDTQITNRVGIDLAQGSYAFKNVDAKQTRRELTANTERIAGAGRMIGFDHRDNRTTEFNDKRPVITNRKPSGQMAKKNYSDYDNQFIGLTRTNSNRSAAQQQPTPYPKTPTATHYGLNNQVIMGSNTRSSRKTDISSTVNNRRETFNPVMKYK